MDGRVVLDEKHFRSCDEFAGNPAKFKSWMFDLITAVGSVDQSLAKDLRFQLKESPKVEVIDSNLTSTLKLIQTIMQSIKVNCTP